LDKEELKNGKLYVYRPNIGNIYYSDDLEVKLLFELFFNGFFGVCDKESLPNLPFDGKKNQRTLL
jgi:hypothetical protein